MMRFFEPEVESLWPVSAAPSDLDQWGTRISGIRNDVVLPMLSSSISTSSELSESWPTSYTTTPTERAQSYDTSSTVLVDTSSNSIPVMGDRKIDQKTITTRDSKRRKMEDPTSDEPLASPAQSMKRSSTVRRSQKLGDKITSLQQLVSPFGKTDTASVLQEATIYIKALHEQIQVLTDPQEHGRSKGGGLRRRGLCLVPITQKIINLAYRAPLDPSQDLDHRWIHR